MNQLQNKFLLHLHNNIIQLRISPHLESQRYQWEASRHCNAEYELHIILKGQISVEVNETHLLLESQQGILIAPGQYHVPSKTNEELEHFSLSFTLTNGKLADAIHKEISSFKIFSISTDMLQECLAIYHERNVFSEYRNEKIYALITSLMISVLRKLNLSPLDLTRISTTELERAVIIDNFFATQIKENPKASHLAEQLHLSERHLNRVLYELYGMNFKEKITRTKMDQATWLLRSTDKKIDEISEAVGYSSEAAFYQAFRKFFQVTPKKYRMQKNKSAEF